MPFKAFPHRLIVKRVHNVTFWLNAFPHNDGVHEVMSPHTILTGLHINHDKHCKLEFGSYAQIHEEHHNSMTAHTTGVIALRPTGNTQGTHYFLNINSGRRVTWNSWTALPMPNEVIHTIHRLAAACKKHKGILFTNKNGNVIDDNSPKDDEQHRPEITGVSTGVGNINNNKNKNNNNTNNNTNITEVSTGVGNICNNTNIEPETLDSTEMDMDMDMPKYILDIQ